MNTEEILKIPKENFRGYESNRKVLEQLQKENLYSMEIIESLE